MAKDIHNHHEDHTEIHVENSSEQTADSGDEVLEQADELEASEQPIKPHMDAIDHNVAELGDRVGELTADLQRVQAEFVNFRRRADDEKGSMMSFATGRIAKEFLAVRDAFDSELKHRPAEIDAKWAASIDSIRAQFDKTMASLGVERFESVGKEFNPHEHEAVAMDGDGSTIVEELQAGYKLGENVLRHAVVKVGDALTGKGKGK